MRKINKITNIALIFTLIGVFLFTSTTYGIDLPKKSHLRSPLLGNNEKSEGRLAKGTFLMTLTPIIEKSGHHSVKGQLALNALVKKGIVNKSNLKEVESFFTNITEKVWYGIHGELYSALETLTEAGIITQGNLKDIENLFIIIAKVSDAESGNVNAFPKLEALVKAVGDENLNPAVLDIKFLTTIAQKTAYTSYHAYSLLLTLLRAGVVTQDNLKDLEILFNIISISPKHGYFVGYRVMSCYSALEVLTEAGAITKDNLKEAQALFSPIVAKEENNADNILEALITLAKGVKNKKLDPVVLNLNLLSIAIEKKGDSEGVAFLNFVELVRNKKLTSTTLHTFVLLIESLLISPDVLTDSSLPNLKKLSYLLIGELENLPEKQRTIIAREFLTSIYNYIITSVNLEPEEGLENRYKNIAQLLEIVHDNLALCLNSIADLGLSIGSIEELIKVLPLNNPLTRIIRMLGENPSIIGGSKDVTEYIIKKGDFSNLFYLILYIAKEKQRRAPQEIAGILEVLREYKNQKKLKEWSEKDWNSFKEDIISYYAQGFKVLTYRLFVYYRQHKDDVPKLDGLRDDIKKELSPSIAWGSFSGLSDDFKKEYNLTNLDELTLLARYMPILNLSSRDYEEVYEKLKILLKEKKDYSKEIDSSLRGLFEFSHAQSSHVIYEKDSSKKYTLLNTLNNLTKHDISLDYLTKDYLVAYILILLIEEAGFDRNYFGAIPSDLSSQQEYLSRWDVLVRDTYQDYKHSIEKRLHSILDDLGNANKTRFIEELVKVKFVSVRERKDLFSPTKAFKKAVKENDIDKIKNLIIDTWFFNIISSDLRDEEILREWFNRGKDKFSNKLSKDTGLDKDGIISLLDSAFNQALAYLKEDKPLSDETRKEQLLLSSMITEIDKRIKELSSQIIDISSGFSQLESQVKDTYYVGLFDDLLHLMEFMMTEVCTWKDRPRQVKEGPHFSIIALKDKQGRLLGTSQVQFLKTPMEGIKNPTSGKGYRVLSLTGINLYEGNISLDREKAFLSIIEAGYRLAKKAGIIPVIVKKRSIRSNHTFENDLIDKLARKGILGEKKLSEKVVLSKDPETSYDEVYIITLPEDKFFLEDTTVSEALSYQEEQDRLSEKGTILVDGFIELIHNGEISIEHAETLSGKIRDILARFPQYIVDNIKFSSQVQDISLRIEVDLSLDSSKVIKSPKVIQLIIGRDIIYEEGKIETLILSERLSGFMAAFILDDYQDLKGLRDTNENAFFKLEVIKVLLNHQNYLPLYYKLIHRYNWNPENYWEEQPDSTKQKLVLTYLKDLNIYTKGLSGTFQWNIFLNVMDDSDPMFTVINYLHLLKTNPFIKDEGISKIIYSIEKLPVLDKVSIVSLRNVLKEFFFNGKVRIKVVDEIVTKEGFNNFDDTQRLTQMKDTLLTTESRDEFYGALRTMIKMVFSLSEESINNEMLILIDRDIFTASNREKAIKETIKEIFIRRIGSSSFNSLKEHLSAQRENKIIPYISLLSLDLSEGEDADKYESLRYELEEGEDINYSLMFEEDEEYAPAQQKDWLSDLFLMTPPQEGTPSQCLRTLYDEFKDQTIPIKDLRKRRIRPEGGYYSKTTVYIELKELMKLGLVNRVKVGKAYHYYLTKFARKLSSDQLDSICNIPELKRYEMRRGKIADTKRKIYNNIQNVSNLKDKAIFAHGIPEDVRLENPIEITEPPGLVNVLIESIEHCTGREFKPTPLEWNLPDKAESTPLEWCLFELCFNAAKDDTGAISAKAYLYEQKKEEEDSSWILEFIVSQGGIKKEDWDSIKETAKRFQEVERKLGIDYLINMDQRVEDGLASPDDGGGGFYLIGKLMELTSVYLEYKKIGKGLETRILIKLNPLFKKPDRGLRRLRHTDI